MTSFAPTITHNAPFCAGGTLQLATDSFPGVSYAWSGPNGFTASTQSASIPNADTAATGSY